MGNWSKQAKAAYSSKDFLQAGDFYKLDGEFKAALKAYLKGKHFKEAAGIHEKMGDLKKAEKVLRKSGDQKALAQFCLRNGNTQDAIEIFLSNGDLFEAAEAYEKLGQLERAAALYAQLQFFEKAGILYGKSKQNDKAIQMFTRVIENLEASPGPSTKSKVMKFKDWIANFHLAASRFAKAGDLFLELTQREKAAKCYHKAGQPTKAAKVLIEMNQHNQARQLLLKNNSPEARALLGEIAMAEGNFNDAVVLLKETQNPKLLSQAYLELGNYKEAASLLEGMGELVKAADCYTRGGEHRKAAVIYEQKGMHAEAADNYEAMGEYLQAARLYSKSGNNFKSGSCYFRAGEKNKALPLLQQVPPDHEQASEAKTMVAQAFMDRKAYSAASTIFEELISTTPLDDSSLPMYYNLATCQEAAGNLVAAKNYFERIFTRKVDFRDVQERMAAIDRKLGNTERPSTTQPSEGFKPQDLVPGFVIANRFRIESTIGKGGMGYIFKVRDLQLDRFIALKMLLQNRSDLEELKAELITARDLTHPYIIKVFDIGEWNGAFYFTMELVEGQTLKAYIESKQGQDISGNIDHDIKLIIKICEGLKVAHDAGVIHRDIKPQNILLDDLGQPKILDFGIARKTSSHQKEKTISGSPKYMAPEQATGGDCDARTDLYAMGIIMFYMFTGMEPFKGSSARDILLKQLREPLPDPFETNPDIPIWLSEIILKACQKKPVLRFQDMEELINELKLNLMEAY